MFSSSGRAEASSIWVLEEVVFSFGPAFRGCLDKRLEKTVRLFGLAVVGVQGHQHIVLFGEAVGGLGKHDGARDGILVVEPGGKLTGSRGELDHTVRFHVREGLEGGVQRHDRRAVNRRIGVTAFLGCLQHGSELFRCGYRHKMFFLMWLNGIAS
jgi:hypothetical protein